VAYLTGVFYDLVMAFQTEYRQVGRMLVGMFAVDEMQDDFMGGTADFTFGLHNQIQFLLFDFG